MSDNPILNTNEVQNLLVTTGNIIYINGDFVICECIANRRDGLHIEVPVDFRWDRGIYKRCYVFTALGNFLPTKSGVSILLSGNWEYNKKREDEIQLRVTSCADYVGKSKQEIVSYLSSGMLTCIGRKTAEGIYKMFGDQSVHILITDPKQLLKVPGIKEKKLEKIVSSFQKRQMMHILAELLTPYGISYPTIVRIHRKLGDKAADIIRDNPYSLCKVSGFSFIKADDIALKMGSSLDSDSRIAGAVQYALETAQHQGGHMYLPLPNLVNICCSEKVLNRPINGTIPPRVDKGKVGTVIKGMVDDSVLYQMAHPQTREQCIYLPDMYLYETNAARSIEQFVRLGSATERDAELYRGVVQGIEKQLCITLDPLQEEAVIMALSSPISILTGGPGTGKTSTIQVLLQAKESLMSIKSSSAGNSDILLAAPTGRAARRITEQTAREATTLHSLLGLRPDESTDFRSADRDLDPAMLIVDEFSMVDAHLLAELMAKVDFNTQLVFVGDADQLPSVGPGNVLKELLAVPQIKSVKLTKVFRQGDDSIIPQNSKKIRVGDTAIDFNRYFKLFKCDNEEQGASIIKKMFSGNKAKDMQEGIQVLAPMRSRGATCTSQLNIALQDILNPETPGKVSAQVGETIFRLGDKVMQTRNIAGASNGDIGYVTSITPKLKGQRDTFAMTVEYDTETVEYDYDMALDLELAYAITIHKSQGGEFPVVVIPIFNSMSFFLQRNVLYTAITRAKVQVVLVGQMAAICRAIKQISSTKRNTLLRELLKEALPPVSTTSDKIESAQSA